MKTTRRWLLLVIFPNTSSRSFYIYCIICMTYRLVFFFLLRTAPNSLFDWAKEKLPVALTEGLPCPKCGKIWHIDDLIEKCKMSPDERLFFKSVETIIKRNAELAK